jgi:phage shock protein C
MTARTNRIYRSRTDVIFFGVCGGLAEHFDMNPGVLRLLVVLLSLCTAVAPGLIVYILFGFALKREPIEHALDRISLDDL